MKVEEMTEEQAKKILKRIIEQLDWLDEEDFFGTEGWRIYLGFGEGKGGV